MSKYFKLAGMMVGGLVLIGAIGFIAIQFVPVDKSNPPVASEPNWDSPQTKALVERACYDCHSNQTKWPWYSNIAPISWLVAHHVEEGRAALNFSEWSLNKARSGEGKEVEGGEKGEAEGNERGEGRQDEDGEGVEVDEVVEEVQKGKMPLRNYVLMHPEARLSDTEIQALISGLKATFGSGTESGMVK